MQKGFTLVELVIVIVIVGVLSIVAVPIYRGYTSKARTSEAKSLTGALQNSQKIYYAEHGVWYELNNWVEYDEVLDIDARGNKYFRKMRTKTSVLKADAVDAGAMSETENMAVFQYWPADLNDTSLTLPRWEVYDKNESVLLSVEN